MTLTRRIMLAATAVAMTAMIAMASGCAKRTDPSRPGAAAGAAAPETASAASGSGSASTSAAASTSELSADDQVREAVFRHLFTHNSSGMKDRAAVYFLSLAEIGKSKDPSPALMARFAQQEPRVEAVSRARVSPDEGVRHRDTGEPGLVFRVTAIKRVSDGVVDVECGYYEGNMSSSGNTYRVERKSGVWVVTDAKMEWIS
jgi:hypothetical protein